MAAAAVVLGAVAAAGWVASVMAGFLVALVAVEAALAMALAVVLARVLRATCNPRVIRAQSAVPQMRGRNGNRAVLPAPPRALEAARVMVQGVVISDKETAHVQQQQQFRQR